MIKKIIVLMILILISINNVNCESGEIIDYIYDSSEYTTTYGIDNIHTGDFTLKLNLDKCGVPDIYKIKNIHMDNKTNYSATAGNVGDPFNIWYSSDGTTKTELIGYGSFYIHKKSDAGIIAGENAFNVDLTFYFDEMNINSELSGAQYFILSGSWVTTFQYYHHFHYEPHITKETLIYNAINAVMETKTTSGLLTKAVYGSTTCEYYSYGSFRNDYNYNVTSSYFDIDIQRQGFNESYDLSSSKIKLVNYTDDITYYQSSFSTSNTSHFLSVGSYNYYIVRELDDYEYLIYTSEEEEEEEEEQPTLTTDKTYYNTSELINISYTNIDKIYDECISSFCDEPYQLWIYALNTPNIPKFRQWLYSDRRDESFTLNTSILSPQTTYQLMITSGENNVIISSDIFYVYPDDEYLSVSCDADADCITYNGIKNTIYYRINNNSNIIIKDNDNNIINTYYNIIGNGSIIYTIPDDLYHENTYPNWKIYLNNTGYSTSFNKGVTVYWSQFQTPTPTPTYTPKPTPDINISDTIDEFKTETQPIKDLIFGLSEIVIDNPDYNKDNIVDESEINHWFNSLIPLCIIFLLIVLYIGLKKNRND